MLGLKLHSIIGRTSSSLWAHPVDVLSCILDVTSFTVNAVGSIDDEPHLSLIVGLVFIHSGRTKPTLRSSILGLIHSLWHIIIHQSQVRRLVGLVVGPGQRDGGEKVKCELAVRLWVLQLLAGRGRLRCICVNAFVLQSPWLLSSSKDIEQASVGHTSPEAELVERWLDIPDRFHLIPDPAALQSLLVQGWVNPLCSTLPRLDCVPHCLGRHHTALHGCVRPLDLWHIHEARAAADKAATREGQLGNCLETSLVQRPSSISNPLSTFKERRHAGVGFELLEGFEGVQVRVCVIQADDKPNCHQVVLIQVVEEGTSVGFDVRQRPTDCMLNSARVVFPFCNSPQLLNTDPIDLVLVVSVQVKLLHQALRQMAPAALTEDGALGLELHPPLKGVLGAAVLGNTYVVCGNTTHTTIFIIQHLCGSEARIDLNTKLFSLFTEPLHKVTHANDIVAMVVHGHAREDGDWNPSSGSEEGKLVLCDGGVQGGASLCPVRDKLIQRPWFKADTRQDMTSH